MVESGSSSRGRDGAVTGVLALQAPARPPWPSRPRREPPPVVANVAHYRHRAEELGDLAADLAAEGLPDIAAMTARSAAHYGALALRLYAQRARELQDGNPDWMVPGHASNFLPVVVLLAFPVSGALWFGIVLLVRAFL